MSNPSRHDWRDRLSIPAGRITQTEHGCWLYGNYADSYPVVNGTPVHRIVFDATKGISSPFSHIHHWCREKNCVNPDHLHELTPSEHKLVHNSHRSATHYQPDMVPSIIRNRMALVISPAEYAARHAERTVTRNG